MKQLEYELQKAVVKWLGYKYPGLLYCASAGGVRTSMTQAKKMKATGYKKGFPDLFIYEPNKKYNGLALELKVKGNYASKHQKEWLINLEKRGYYAKCVKGFDETIEIINKYTNNEL